MRDKGLKQPVLRVIREDLCQARAAISVSPHPAKYRRRRGKVGTAGRHPVTAFAGIHNLEFSC
jgi:hypothetical protein